MFQIKHILNAYGTKIKYGLGLVLLFAMILAIRTYINYVTIIDTTHSVNRRSASVENEMNFAQYFQAKYLASEYGHLFLAHDNSSIFWWESIISFKTSGEAVGAPALALNHIPDRRDSLEQALKNLTPPEAWQQFIRERIDN